MAIYNAGGKKAPKALKSKAQVKADKEKEKKEKKEKEKAEKEEERGRDSDCMAHLLSEFNHLQQTGSPGVREAEAEA